MANFEMIDKIVSNINDESINIDNTNNTSKRIKTSNSSVIFLSEDENHTRTTSSPSARPPGKKPEALSSGQKACRVSELAKPETTLAQEKINLVQQSQWLTTPDIDYVKVSVYPRYNGDGLRGYQLQYNIKVRDLDLKQHRYVCRVTHRHNDYLGYAKSKWADWDAWPVYKNVAQVVKECNEQNGMTAFAGRCSPNNGWTNKKTYTPNIAWTTCLLYLDTQEQDWVCQLLHTDVDIEMRIPGWEWNSEQGNYQKGSRTPMTCFEYRRPL